MLKKNTKIVKGDSVFVKEVNAVGVVERIMASGWVSVVFPRGEHKLYRRETLKASE